jgi:hypothetical protein
VAPARVAARAGPTGAPDGRQLVAAEARPADRAVPAGQEAPRTKAEPAGADPAVPEAATLARPGTGSRSPGSRTPALAVLAVDLQTGRPGLVTTRLAAVALHPPAPVGARRQGRVLAQAADPALVMAQPPAAGQRLLAAAADQRRVTAPVVAAGRRPATARPLAAGQSRPAAAGTGHLAAVRARPVTRRRDTALATGPRAETPAQAAHHRPDTALGAVTPGRGTVRRPAAVTPVPGTAPAVATPGPAIVPRRRGIVPAAVIPVPGTAPAAVIPVRGTVPRRRGTVPAVATPVPGTAPAVATPVPRTVPHPAAGTGHPAALRVHPVPRRRGTVPATAMPVPGAVPRPVAGTGHPAAVRVHPVPRRRGTVPAVATPGPAIVPQRAAGQELATAQAPVVRRGPTNGLVPTAAGQAGRAAATGPATRLGAAQARAALQAARTRAADGGRRAIPVLAAGVTTTLGRTATEVRHGPPTGGAGRRGGTGRGRLAAATTASVAASPAAPAIAAVQMATAATATADPALRATIAAPSTHKPAPTSCASPYRTASRRSSLIRRRRPSCAHCPATWPVSSRGCSLLPASRKTLTRPTGTRRRRAASQPESASSGRHAPSPLIRPVTGMLPWPNSVPREG